MKMTFLGSCLVLLKAVIRRDLGIAEAFRIAVCEAQYRIIRFRGYAVRIYDIRKDDFFWTYNGTRWRSEETTVQLGMSNSKRMFGHFVKKVR